MNRKIYFNRNSVLSADLDPQDINTEVRFHGEQEDQVTQTGTVRVENNDQS